ncbi:zinc-dependent metalloprotease [Microbacterium sp. EYE_5]|uniref:zinc-dependent metalloprotease n=1 Tax=unclassified Microbacterium TaxID=2609290 RepID=UPI00200672D9|nr:MULTISPECIES: zinc-dependent metalloprotease [unclassified Microbacterium]MCK6081016.1 zinc-dependent metalloprotease [Microbacterium sp. EYE_382]MCK6086286.1 zinc-dependent metalloprotease [Microbacterium sp. EYE_384]MCK6124216.1 zinc-dependent metalloprotease [Microbacterium sp. EYE_80]MCK6127125.1 zinc-dependent metalloprotease [Microbacterium sp. EYE_79]MCK6141971.1 zinc-dependent metalloprotease [Microbacterium sp. EYE_39]
MTDDDRPGDDDFAEMLRRMLSGQGGIDPEQLRQFSGMNIDPAMMQAIMRQLQSAMADTGGDEGIDWSAAKTQALHIANRDGLGISAGARTEFDQAFALASLWLGEATAIAELPAPPRAITRGQWVEATLPVWQELAEPVASSISDALMAALESQTPEEMRAAIEGAGRLMRRVGGALFASQLGAVIGRLSLEVVSGGDVGIPLMPDGEATILPQNFADFGRDLEIEEDQLALALATRELAHARLFRHARWLRLHVISQITDFARGVHVDTDALEELASRFDPSSPDELRAAIESGALLPQRSEAQVAALTRLENLLATIEGWVDVVTADATSRLPAADRIAEAVRRRRAVGGPGEQAMASLVGLELRPRRLREAAAMWRAVTDAVGPAARDSLWDYPDLMPTAEDIDDPASLVARLQARARGEEPTRDAFDDALAALLDEESGSGGDTAADGPDDGPSGPRPV